MKILSASCFLVFGLAIGTAISAIADDARGVQPIEAGSGAKDYVQVMESKPATRPDDSRR